MIYIMVEISMLHRCITIFLHVLYSDLQGMHERRYWLMSCAYLYKKQNPRIHLNLHQIPSIAW